MALHEMNTTFHHKLYGRCALVPNIDFWVVKSMDEVESINYINLETGIIKASGVEDAGIFQQTNLLSDSKSREGLTKLFTLFKYIESVK